MLYSETQQRREIINHTWQTLEFKCRTMHCIQTANKHSDFIQFWEQILAAIHTKHRVINCKKKHGNFIYHNDICNSRGIRIIHWGNRTMVAAATIVSMAAAKKAQQNVFAFYHSYNRTILPGFIWILDFHFKIVLVLRRRYLISIRCDNGKRKMWPWRWLHHFDFQHWRWLYALMTMVALFGREIFDTHTADPLQTNMLIGRMIVVKCDTCKISGAYAHLDCIKSTVDDIGNMHSMQVSHSYTQTQILSLSLSLSESESESFL